MVAFCEDGNEPLGVVKVWNFLTDYASKVFKVDLTSWSWFLT